MITTWLDQLPQSDRIGAMSTMTMRVDRRKVNDAKTILAGMGLTPRAAIDVFLAKVLSRKAILFQAYSEYALIENGATHGEFGRIHPASFDG